MISTLGAAAHWLDAWLREHLGRAYAPILGVGLMIGVVASLQGLGRAIGSGVDVLKIAGMVLFQLALLTNQLAEFHDFRQERRRRRAVRGGKSPSE